MQSSSLTALAVALMLTAACSSKRPAQLPPAPPSETDGSGANTDGGVGADQGGVEGAAVPGSQRHFLTAVPSDRVFFDTDEYGLSADDRSTLDAQAQYLAQYPAVTITIEGHADERGTREYNLALGERRANSVRNYLESRGVGANRMTTISWGKERPAVEGSSEQAWAQNRRAVTVLPN
jgi:peptidoglycan-associated lipoprotein